MTWYCTRNAPPIFRLKYYLVLPAAPAAIILGASTRLMDKNTKNNFQVQDGRKMKVTLEWNLMFLQLLQQLATRQN